MNKLGIAIHGGAGTISPGSMDAAKEKAYRDGLQEALHAGYSILNNNGSALDAVEQAVRVLEDNPLFNAGRGSVFTHEGKHEMDASIMDGSGRAGAVACISGVRYPVSLARAVMEHSNHVLLCGKGAEDFARKMQFAFEDESWFFTRQRYEQWQQVVHEDTTLLDHSAQAKAKFGTVGAAALDAHGHLAAATSTGGMTNKRYGRVGDTPLIGCGTYAQDGLCAISCTGHGEYFIRSVAAYDVAALMKYKGLSLADACRDVVTGLKDIGGEGGLIAIDASGNIVLEFNSEGMYRGQMNAEGSDVKIYV